VESNITVLHSTGQGEHENRNGSIDIVKIRPGHHILDAHIVNDVRNKERMDLSSGGG
jgi:hypothetical protein